MRLLVSAGLLMAGLAFGAPKKPRKPPTPPVTNVAPCQSFAACVAELNDAFEAGDFELAQRLAGRAESMASGPSDKAQILVLRGALDYQSAGATEEIKDAVRAKFAEAARLDPQLSVVAIPSFARTDALEALLIEARPRVEVARPAPEPPPSPPALVTEPAPSPRRFPVVATIFGGMAVASASVGLGLRVHANAEYASAQGDAVFDVDRFRLVESARANGAASTGLWLGAAASLALALVFLLLER